MESRVPSSGWRRSDGRPAGLVHLASPSWVGSPRIFDGVDGLQLPRRSEVDQQLRRRRTLLDKIDHFVELAVRR